MEDKIRLLCIPKTSSIRQAIACIDRNRKGVVLITDEKRRLLGTITDGDIRRALLAGQNLDVSVSELLARKNRSPYPKPITAPIGTGPAELLELMCKHAVRQIPILDGESRVAGLVAMEELLPQRFPTPQAVIMAGGYGTRLKSLTDSLPKAMLPVGKEPLLQLIIKRLHKAGIRQVDIATHYKAKKIVEHFGDGSALGVQLRYLAEDRPLGTAGALGLMERPKDPFFVINGDVLTNVNFQAMLAFHREQRAEMTVAVQKYDVEMAYGIVQIQKSLIRQVVEKPKFQHLVNAGIYLLQPSVQSCIPKEKYFDMTDLIQKLIDKGRRVAGFPIWEYWLDIGNLVEYKKAREDAKRKG